MSRAAWSRGQRAVGAYAATGSLMVGVVACGTSSTLFAGHDSPSGPALTGQVRLERSTVRVGAIYHLSVPATYGACTVVGTKPPPGTPQCLAPGNLSPPLPAGFYRASLAEADHKLQRELAHVRPAYVRITG